MYFEKLDRFNLLNKCSGNFKMLKFIEKLNDKYFILCLISYLLLLGMTYVFSYESIWILIIFLLFFLFIPLFLLPFLLSLHFVWGVPVLHIFGHYFSHIKLYKKGWFGFILLLCSVFYLIIFLFELTN